MRLGWSLNEAAAVLDVHPNRVTQALGPAVCKIAKLYRISAHKTMIAILAELDQLEPMTESEITLRMEMLGLRVGDAPRTERQRRDSLLRRA